MKSLELGVWDFGVGFRVKGWRRERQRCFSCRTWSRDLGIRVEAFLSKVLGGVGSRVQGLRRRVWRSGCVTCSWV